MGARVRKAGDGLNQTGIVGKRKFVIALHMQNICRRIRETAFRNSGRDFFLVRILFKAADYLAFANDGVIL